MTLWAASLLTLGAVALLLFLVLAVRLHAFLALLLTSLLVGVVGGLPLDQVADELRGAVGSTLGYIAVVIGLGAIFGELMAASGGAARIAGTLVERLDERRAPSALGLAGLLVAIPVFFDVAFILFVPMVRDLAQRTGRSLMTFAAPLLVGLAIAHSFIPPTPGPVAVAGLLGADLGWVLGFGLVAGLVCWLAVAVLVGPKIARSVKGRLPPEDRSSSLAAPGPSGASSESAPSFALCLALVCLPLFLILLGTVAGVILEKGTVRSALELLGHPFVALLLATLLASALLARSLASSETSDGSRPRRDAIGRLVSRAFEPVGAIILITGAGGALGKMLLATGAGETLADALARSGLPTLVLAFCLALAVRVAQGSATVSMVTAAGLVAPLLETVGADAALRAALTIAIASGATACSHVNDSGFWLVSRYLGLSEAETLRSWTVLTTLIGFAGLLCAAATLQVASLF